MHKATSNGQFCKDPVYFTKFILSMSQRKYRNILLFDYCDQKTRRFKNPFKVNQILWKQKSLNADRSTTGMANIRFATMI